MIVRWAVVTGASRGIGWAIAERLSADGYGIVATGRDVNRLDSLAQLISDRGGQVETRVVDFTSAEEVEVFALDLVAGNYQIGALVNNAGFVEVFKYQETPKRLWKNAFQVNLQSPLQLIHALNSQMAPGSSIVNVGSILGTRATKSVTPYVVTKGALHYATQVLALELSEQGIRVNAVAPGFIATDMFETGHTQDNKERIARAHPLGRVGTGAEVAAAVSFLCSAEASFITGVVLPVDGGLAATMIIPDLGGAQP